MIIDIFYATAYFTICFQAAFGLVFIKNNVAQYFYASKPPDELQIRSAKFKK
jgi:hypothetical protein